MGYPLDFESRHVVYCVDALTNYITVSGYDLTAIQTNV